jgi:hypothetical protein
LGEWAGFTILFLFLITSLDHIIGVIRGINIQASFTITRQSNTGQSAIIQLVIFSIVEGSMNKTALLITESEVNEVGVPSWFNTSLEMLCAHRQIKDILLSWDGVLASGFFIVNFRARIAC